MHSSGTANSLQNTPHTHRVVMVNPVCVFMWYWQRGYVYMLEDACMVSFPHSGDHANALLHYEKGITKSPEVHV